MENSSLAGRVAVVTGASSGIGAACARLLAAHGAKIVVGYNRGRERAEALCAELPGEGHVPAAVPLDDAIAHAALAHLAHEVFGHVDILVNSAGYTQRIPHTDLATLTSDLFNEIVTVNAGGTYAVTRALLPLLQASGNGLVVNISSVSASTGSGSNIAYCAAKAAVETMTLSLARAFGPAVRFLCVSPASVDTDFVSGRTREEVAKKAQQSPLGRVVTPEDVALAVLSCATHLKTATGTSMVIDGGHRL